jgi:uncharacterized DUF497 family protein
VLLMKPLRTCGVEDVVVELTDRTFSCITKSGSFRWNDWNVEHLTRHSVAPEEAESVIRAARRPFPRKIEEDKWLVWGQGRGGQFLQVIYVLDSDKTVYVIHARPLNEQEKRRLRRGKR